MYYIYILQSIEKGGYYVGHTADLSKRIEKHNRGEVKSTKSKKPWRLVYFEKFETRSVANLRERQIKSYKGGEAFKKLLQLNQ